jgi:transcriptional regulator GlxA family with amidase domain
MKTIAIVAFDKFTDIDVFLPWDLFNRVKLIDKNVKVVIAGSAPIHTSVTGLKIETHATIEDCSNADVVFFASGPGTRQVTKDAAWLERFNLDPSRQVIASMCSGALILAALGILDGLTATTYPTAIEALESYGVEVEEKPLVIHGNVATAAGCLAALDLIDFILTKLFGGDVSEDVLASIKPVGKGLECIY